MLKRLPQFFLLLSLSTVYGLTLAPGLTWANYGADGGDLTAAALTGGIAHPGGYPTYLLLARLFLWLPFHSPAFRLNLMSAAFAVGAAPLVYEIIRILENRPAAFISALAFGLSPLFWSQAVITEVYALHVFFLALLLLLRLKESRPFWLGLVFGLSLGNHLTTILALPLLFRKEKNALLQSGAGLVLGALVYLALPLRALNHPPINWGNPVTFSNFLWLVTGSLYRGLLFAESPLELLNKIQTAAALLLEQFGVVGLALGFFGLVSGRAPKRFALSMGWLSSAFLFFALSYAARDWFLHLLPLFLCFSIWMGIGLARGMELAPRWKPALALLLLALTGIRAVTHWNQVDASRDTRAEDFARRALAQFPPNAVVFTEGDEATLSLWYFHYGLGERPDVALVASELLPGEWYQQTLRAAYPSVNFPQDYFMFASEIVARNPARAVCSVGRSLVVRCESR